VQNLVAAASLCGGEGHPHALPTVLHQVLTKHNKYPPLYQELAAFFQKAASSEKAVTLPIPFG
jgi:hypothetical protein